MINILCISGTFNHAEIFLTELKSDLEKLGISDIEFDKRDCQIKTKDFVVTAKGINTSCISLDCRIANYCIFYCIYGTRLERYENEKTRAKTYRHVKFLRDCFRQNTKELKSKDELIQILTENVK